jgi:hypothetical protein
LPVGGDEVPRDLFRSATGSYSFLPFSSKVVADQREAVGGCWFRLWLSLLMEMFSPERPGAVKGAPIGAAKRTLDREDRSEIIAEEGKPESDSGRF